jgi:F-type H+-transporting ATPase subunit b
MNISGWTLAFQAINFLLLVWLLQRFLYKPVLAALDRRRAETDRVTREAAETKQAAEAMRADVQRQRDGLTAERAQVLETAMADAERERQKELAEGRAEAAALLEQGQAKVEHEEKEARARIQSEATAVAVDLARRLLTSVPAGAVSVSLLDAVLSELEAMPAPDRDRLTGARKAHAEISIVVPENLPPAELDTARGRLVRAVGGDPVVDVRVEPELIAGVELRFPYAILRRNWRDGLHAAQERLAAA